MTGAFVPTEEQRTALALFSTGRNLAIQAGAGTGKSRTLQLLAESCPDRVGIYTAFNKAIVTDAGAKMPATTTCATMHSLAMRSIDRRYRAKLDRSKRMRPADAAKALGVEGLPVGYGTERKFLAKGFLASLALKAIDRFCQSGDPAPAAHHVPYIEGIDVPRPDGTRGYSNNDLVRAHLVPAMARAWADILTFDGGRLTSFSLGHCLKIFERTHPVLMADYVMVDEAQDLNGVMISIIEQQQDVQLVFVGDSAQSINEWMGSIDALAKVPADNTTYLTASFRFGPAIADVANGLLSRLGAQLRLAGRAPHMSVVAAVAEADCILTRTNAEAVKTVLRILGEGRRPFLMGGGADVVRFAEAAQALQNGEWTGHPDLSCFTDWGQVQAYVQDDPQGSDLRLLVDLIDEYGPEKIVATLNNPVPASGADVTVSTAHKSKGCEWDSVQLAGDFFAPRDGADLSAPELKLLYVACTRARRELDVTLVPHAVKAPTAAPTVALDSVVAEPPAAIALGPAPEALSGPSTPLSCPTCGREDVVRGGLVGAHRCVAVAR